MPTLLLGVEPSTSHHWQHNFHAAYRKVRKKQFDHETGTWIIGCALLWAEYFCWWGTLDAETFASVHVWEIEEPIMHNPFKEWDYASLGLFPVSIFLLMGERGRQCQESFPKKFMTSQSTEKNSARI